MVKGLGLVLSIILARLLEPEIFGQLALLMVFVDISHKLIEGGLATALVQSKEADDRDFSTVFYITMMLSLLFVAVLQLAAPYIARFYKSAELVAPLRFYSFSLLLSSFNSIQFARFQREMRFKEMMYSNLWATVISGALGIFLAFMNFGLWALVIYYFAQMAVSSLAMFYYMRWFPHSRFSMDSAKRLYGFGIKLMMASVITVIYNNVRTLIIGKKFSVADLAYYERGQRLSTTISWNLDSAVQAVMLPVLAKVQDNMTQFGKIFLRTKKLGSFVIFPAMFGMMAAAEPMVRVLLTDKWLPCVVFVQMLCLAEAQVPITTSNLLALKALGRSDIFAKLELIRRGLMITVLIISVFAFDSVEAIAMGYLLSAWMDVVITAIPLVKLTGLSVFNQLKDLWKCSLSAVLMAAAVYSLNALSIAAGLKLCLQIITGVLVYFTLCLILKEDSLKYLIDIIKSKKRR